MTAKNKATPKDLIVTAIVDELREEAHECRQEDKSSGVFADHQMADMLDEWANKLEISHTATLEDVYSQCAHLVDPLVQAGKLPASVVESVEMLIEFRNAHDDLVKALTALVDCISETRGKDAYEALEAARAALAKAKGETK